MPFKQDPTNPHRVIYVKPNYSTGKKELTDEEIIDAWKKFPNWGNEQHIVMFGRELIKKASEK